MPDSITQIVSLAVFAVIVAPNAFIPASAAQTPKEPALRISRSVPALNPALAKAFQAFMAGDLATAEESYARVLKSEPSNPDALHGAAIVALRQGQRARAETHFQRALSANPHDAFAIAGLAGLIGHIDPALTESRLKSQISAQPDQPNLHFALGNIYAATGRWPDAQRAYFSAHVGDPEQPDYLFNLAVSLDHLRRRDAARDCYRKALAATVRRPAAFVPSQAADRIGELTR